MDHAGTVQVKSCRRRRSRETDGTQCRHAGYCQRSRGPRAAHRAHGGARSGLLEVGDPVVLDARGVGGLELAEAGAEELGLRGRGGVGVRSDQNGNVCKSLTHRTLT